MGVLFYLTDSSSTNSLDGYHKNKSPNTAQARLKSVMKKYPLLEDGSVDLSKIPEDKKCNVCGIGECDTCPTSRCDCNKACHGNPYLVTMTLRGGSN